MNYFREDKKVVLKKFEVDENTGLTTSEVVDRQFEYGKNEFSKKEETSIFKEILESITEPLMLILLAAALISGIIGEIEDAIGIVVAIVIGISIGIFTEGRSKKAAEALSKMTEDIEVSVLRDGNIARVNKSELVPGDIVILEAGDMIPADGRLIETLDLKIREDILTGESDDVNKNSEVIIKMESITTKDNRVIEQEPVPAKQANMVFGGTLIAYGRGKMVVTAIGDSTEMGKIALYLEVENEDTPLQKKLGDLGRQISKFATIVAIILFGFMIFSILKNEKVILDTTSFTEFLNSINPIKSAFVICVALIVAAVPEGLPTMINITLAITMQKMAKINALVTKKEACETIGSVSVICSDKTGTLTQNRMTVEKVYINGSFNEGDFEDIDNYFLHNCLINSTAHITYDNNEYKYLGSATECALLLYYKYKNYIEYRLKNKISQQIPFSSKRKRMNTLLKEGNNLVLLSKGAPEIILGLCKYEYINNKIVELSDERRNEINNEIETLQRQSMRVLGFGYKIIDEVHEEAALTSEMKSIEDSLIFTGFVAIRDPLREDVKKAVNVAKNAGISTKMLTGDNINTAISIGEELGLLKDDMRAVESSYIDTLSDEELNKEIITISIVARSKPDTKMRIVKALQKNGEVVAVTGDGINDAPALSKADVGIAMGISGTEVSKNASDIILTDDSFSTIVKGIKWGRGIYENFQRFIQFQLTVNIVAFFVAIISQVMGKQMPFTTIQLLWVNIIMDGPPALVLGLEPIRDKVLNRKPVNRNSNIITKSMIISIILNAAFISLIILVQMFFNPLKVDTSQNILNEKFLPNEMSTVLFGLFAFSALFNSFNCREFGLDSILPSFTKNKLAIKVILFTMIAQVSLSILFKDFFNVVSISPKLWIEVIFLGATVVIVNEIVKFIVRRVLKVKNHNQ